MENRVTQILKELEELWSDPEFMLRRDRYEIHDAKIQEIRALIQPDGDV